MQYRIYGNHKEFGWKLIAIVYKEEDADLFMETLSHDINYEYGMVIKHNIELDQDEVYVRRRK